MEPKIQNFDIKLHLKKLEEILEHTTSTTEDKAKAVCKHLPENYKSEIIWLKKKNVFISKENSDRDDIGQTLIPDNMVTKKLEFFACKVSGKGSSLFNSAFPYPCWQ